MILVIDDEPTITELISDVLEYHGYPVMVAHDAEAALEIIPLQRPQAILVDLMMPATDGLSLAMTLRRHPDTRGVPLIAMSASGSALELADRLGDFDTHISKPFEHDHLLSVVNRAVAKFGAS